MQTFRRKTPVIDRLRSMDPFSGYNTAQLREVARLAEQVRVGEGKTLIREGQFGKEFFLILSGNVEVTRKGRVVNALGPGDFFGELAVLNRRRRNATVTALSDLDLLIIGRREFNAMFEIPQFRDALFQRMANRLQIVDAQLATASMGRQEALIPFDPRASTSS